jgi:hypothetical protein
MRIDLATKIRAKSLIFQPLLMAVSLLLVGCPATTAPRYLTSPQTVSTQGAYVHAASGMVLPERVGPFARQSVLRYDVDGRDISGGYLFGVGSERIVATVYVYPGPTLTSIGSPADVVASAKAKLTESEFRRRQDEILRFNPTAKLIEEHDVSRSEAGRIYVGKAATYELIGPFGNDKIPLTSRLYVYCFVDPEWAIEYRFSYPRQMNADAAIQQFIDDWSWRGGRP